MTGEEDSKDSEEDADASGSTAEGDEDELED